MAAKLRIAIMTRDGPRIFVLFDRRPFGKDAADRDGGAEGGKNEREQPRRRAGPKGETALPG
jgi:hypothetical protein